MATPHKQAAPAPAYDPARDYDVRVARVVWLGSMKLLPRDPHVIRGDVLNDHDRMPAEAVAEAIPRPERERSAEAVASIEDSAARLRRKTGGDEVVIPDAEA